MAVKTTEGSPGQKRIGKIKKPHKMTSEELKELTLVEQQKIVKEYGFELEYENYRELRKKCPRRTETEPFSINFSGKTSLDEAQVHTTLKGSCSLLSIVLCYEQLHRGSLVFNGLHRLYGCPHRTYKYKKSWIKKKSDSSSFNNSPCCC